MARTFYTPPTPSTPQRPQVDRVQMGRELADTIRRNKTMGAINKALEQHGTLSSPEAIETVRKAMGTWFSDPEKIIALQDKLFTRKKGLRQEEREDTKTEATLIQAEAQAGQVEVAADQVVLNQRKLDVQEQQDKDRLAHDERTRVDDDTYRVDLIRQIDEAAEAARITGSIERQVKLFEGFTKEASSNIKYLQDSTLSGLVNYKTSNVQIAKWREVLKDIATAHRNAINRVGVPVDEDEDGEPVKIETRPKETLIDTMEEDITTKFGALTTNFDAALSLIPNPNTFRPDTHSRYKGIYDKWRIAKRGLDTLISRGKDTTQLNTSIANLEAQMSKIIKQNEDPIKEELRRKAGTPTIVSGTLDLEGGQGVVGGGVQETVEQMIQRMVDKSITTGRNPNEPPGFSGIN